MYIQGVVRRGTVNTFPFLSRLQFLSSFLPTVSFPSFSSFHFPSCFFPVSFPSFSSFQFPSCFFFSFLPVSFQFLSCLFPVSFLFLSSFLPVFFKFPVSFLFL